MRDEIVVKQLTAARIPTPYGSFSLCFYDNNQDDKEHLALVIGEVNQAEKVLVRIHSECFTGDVLGSRRCDCGEQLQLAMRAIAAEGCGIILYMRQEGRGIGLYDKLQAYNLQDEGYDTVEANLMLGHGADERDYTLAAYMLRDLGVQSVRLMTNNPTKVEGLQMLGIQVAERVPVQSTVHADNAAYLQTKVERMRHLLTIGRNGRSHTPKRPTVTLSYAQGLDGSITTKQGEPTTISGEETLLLTHQLRAQHQAILVGIGTVLADDPRLTVRLVEGTSPQPIILDSQLRLPLDATLWQHIHAPLVFTAPDADPTKKQALQEKGAEVVSVAVVNGRLSLPAILTHLAQRGVHSLMVEGGATVLTSFLQARLVDKVVLTIAPTFLGGFRGVGQLEGALPRLKQVQYQTIGEDIVVSGEVVWEPTNT